jgi:monoamine oxidase
MTTEMSDTPSSLSSSSSHGPCAAEYETKESTQALLQALTNQTTPLSTKPRNKYDVRPKVSIPTDIASSEYARQCIAAAESSRLNPYALHPEEYELLRTHLSLPQVTTYLNIRNGILRLWIRNPLIGVMRDEAIGVARDIRWFDVAAVCYEWLIRKGYINFGCLENIPRSVPHTKRSGKRKRKTVAVIGAGMSGLGCARQLEGLFAHFEERFREQGEDAPNVIVLEGRDRVGGRVYSRGLKSDTTASTLTDGNRCTAEMGGMIITGFDRGNPLNILVRGQLALSYHALRPTTTLYDSNGQAVNQTRDQLAEKLYNDILDRVSDYKFKLPPPLNIEGDKDLIDNCRDIHGDGGKPMSASENIDIPQTPNGTSTNPSNTVVPKVEVVPVSSDRLTGKSHLEPGIPAIHKAAYKAQLMGWSLKEGVDDSVDLDLDAAVEGNGSTLGSVMDAAISQYRDVVHIMPLDLRLLNWHIANLEYSNAINYNELSLGGWDVDAGNEWEGKHSQIIGGYQQVPRGLLHCPQPLNVRKKSAVKRIIYASDAFGSAKIECEDGSHVDADVVVSTIPLGILKTNDVIFEPELPGWKTGAIERLGFGILNKVVLIYKTPFWDQSRDIFGVLRDPLHRSSLNQKDYATKRGRFFQWFNCTKTSGVPTLIALMAGDAAFQTEGDSNHSLVAEATQVLRSVFGETVPEPVEAIITRWGSDKFARGSYSYTGPNFQPDDYEVMAKPIGNLFFAGEHTCGTHPATVHGAYISGLRAASEVLEAMIGPIEVPDPLLLPKETAKDLKRKASEELRNAAPKDLTQARLEAYENEIWTAIYAKFGDYPIPPPKPNSNPYILFGKDNFENARKKCEDGRRPGKGRSGPNDVRVMLSKMWKETSEEEKRPYQERAKEAKSTYTAALANYTELAKKWNVESLEFRRQYEAEHPSMPSNEELAMQKEILPYKKDRRAKRVSGYAEDSPSDIDI